MKAVVKEANRLNAKEKTVSYLTSPEDRAVYNYIEKLVTEQKTTTYTPVGTLVGMDPHDRRLWAILGRVTQESHRLHGVCFSAIVVGFNRGYPGREFFDLARELGFKFKDPVEFWAKHLRAVYDFKKSS